MALETSRQRLVRNLREACEQLAGLETIVGDHPSDHPPALVERLGEALLDAHGRVEDALEAAARLASGEGGPRLAEAARATLPVIFQAVHRAIFDCLLNLAEPGNGAELARIARLRGGEWAAWVGVIRPSLAQCVRLLEAAHASMGDCWCDIFDGARGWPSSVHQVVNICHRDPGLAPAHLEASLSKPAHEIP
jgi:hypothetical protein